jgi:hypothetical protein
VNPECPLGRPGFASLPEPPELPKEIKDQLAVAGAQFDIHAKTLEQWAEMAKHFYDEMLRQFLGARFAPGFYDHDDPDVSLVKTMLLNWQTVFFTELYRGSLEMQEEDEGD